MDQVHARRTVLGVAVVLLASVTASPTFAPRGVVEAQSRPLAEARALFDGGGYARAETLTRALLTEAEERTGADSLETAAVIDLLVEILSWEMKSFQAETLELAQRALRIRERRLGAAHLDVATSAYRLGVVWFDRKEFDLSLGLIQRSLTLRRSAGGAANLAVAESIEALGLLHIERGKLDQARPCLEQALEIRTLALGLEHPLVADILMSLGNLAYATSDYETVERLFRDALAIREKSLGPDHPKVAGALNNLAVAHQLRGDLDGARALYQRALDIRNASLDHDAPRLATTHLAVATLDRMAGDYTAARQHYRRALDSYERWLGQEHVKYAIALTQLADLNQLAGDFSVAREQFERALEIRRRVLGASHPDVAKNLFHLGYLLLVQGDPAGARDRFNEALAMSPEDPQLKASTRVRLALSLNELGETGRAKELLETSLRTMEQAFGENSPELIVPITSLASILLSSGETERAVTLFREGRALTERYYGPDHPDVAAILRGEAIGLLELGRATEAMQTALRAAEIARTHLGSTSGALSERQALAYAAHSKVSVDIVLTVLTSLPRPSGDAVGDAWDALLRLRGLVLDEMTARHRYVEDSSDARVRSLAEDLRSVGQQLANVVVRGPGQGGPEQDAKTLATLRARREALELDLAVESRRFREDRARGRLGIEEVAASLPALSALVAYAQFDRYDPAHASEAAVPAMVALVLPARGSSATLIDLGHASEVDRAVADWQTEASSGYLQRSDRPAEAERVYRRVGASLRQLVWDPVSPHLEGAEQVLIVPAGNLSLVSFAALPDGSTGYLVEGDPVLHLLTTERDLVPQPDGGVEGRGLLAIGGPDFDAAPSGSDATTGGVQTYRGPRAACIDLRKDLFGALPNTAREVEEVAALWSRGTFSKAGSDGVTEPAGHGIIDPLVLTGADATEARFKREVGGRRVVHVASHGFFLGNRCLARTSNLRGIGGLAPSGGPTSPVEDGDPPQLLSGLVLAGANRRAESAADEDDGILTAEEIAALDLSGVEWVVLSACQTGLGQVQVGEGVFGLRRAFRVAGARTTIMSLWSVDDRATRAWMRNLYEGRHADRLSTAESVRHAMRNTLRWVRASGGTTHPFFWGGFVAAGDWR